MKRLQQVQAQADERWGFDFDAFDDLVAPQQSLPAAGFARIEPEVEKLHRQLEYVVLALAGEVGELANLVKKARRDLLMKGGTAISLRLVEPIPAAHAGRVRLPRLCREARCRTGAARGKAAAGGADRVGPCAGSSAEQRSEGEGNA